MISKVRPRSVASTDFEMTWVPKVQTNRTTDGRIFMDDKLILNAKRNKTRFSLMPFRLPASCVKQITIETRGIAKDVSVSPRGESEHPSSQSCPFNAVVPIEQLIHESNFARRQ
jgi:hypothetical protein